MSAQYRVTFQHRATGSRHDMYLSSADATALTKAACKLANKKAVAKAKDRLKRKPHAIYGGLKDNFVTDVLCVG